MNKRITLKDLHATRKLSRQEQRLVSGGIVRPPGGIYCYWYVFRGRWYRTCPRW